ncbi:hypothetical protein N0V90_012996 [Kalmusia sp. IMI 367209]|nr:hypothetical protein N0V90_012996 [Kalmusia sp. IMI 367209]
MKFAYIASALLAAFVAAQPTTPIQGEKEFALDYASGNVTGEIAPQLVTLAERSLEKRSNVQFEVFSSDSKIPLYSNRVAYEAYRRTDCGGSGTVITVTGSGQKNDFSLSHSVRIFQLTNGWHLTLYTGKAQSGVLTRFFATEVGADKCFVGSWQSWGLFSS